jgi:hypothetical protein
MLQTNESVVGNDHLDLNFSRLRYFVAQEEENPEGSECAMLKKSH